MRYVDLDKIDWTQCPRDLLDMANIDTVKTFLYRQPSPVAVPIAESEDPKVRMAAITTAMHFSQALQSLYPLMLEMANTLKKKGE